MGGWGDWGTKETGRLGDWETWRLGAYVSGYLSTLYPLPSTLYPIQTDNQSHAP